VYNFKDQAPSSEPDSSVAVQELSHLLWKPKVHFLLTRTRRWAWASWSQFRLIHFNILPSTPRSPKWCLPVRCLDQNFVWISHRTSF